MPCCIPCLLPLQAQLRIKIRCLSLGKLKKKISSSSLLTNPSGIHPLISVTASLCQTQTLSRCFHHDINNKNWHVLNEESLVVPGSTDGYLGKLTAPEKCFCHDQHFSDRFLMALTEPSLTWTRLQMKWKVVKCAALTLLKVRGETWNNSEICF